MSFSRARVPLKWSENVVTCSGGLASSSPWLGHRHDHRVVGSITARGGWGHGYCCCGQILAYQPDLSNVEMVGTHARLGSMLMF